VKNVEIDKKIHLCGLVITARIYRSTSSHQKWDLNQTPHRDSERLAVVWQSWQSRIALARRGCQRWQSGVDLVTSSVSTTAGQQVSVQNSQNSHYSLPQHYNMMLLCFCLTRRLITVADYHGLCQLPKGSHWALWKQYFFYMSDAILGFQSTMSESRKAATVSCYNIMTILDVADDILLILC